MPNGWIGGRRIISPALPTSVAALLAAVWIGTATAAVGAPVGARQPLVAIGTVHTIRVSPTLHAARIGGIAAHRPLTSEQTVLPLLGRATDSGGRRWLHVELPGRPNGHSGWILAWATHTTSTPWHLVVHTGNRRLLVYRSGRLVRSFPAIVGKPSTPTPTGAFFVEEVIKMPRGEPGGPYALALSARSQVLQEFDGGPGQIALHGLDNLGGRLGSAVSHGCVRLADATTAWLVVRIGPGVPVTDHRVSLPTTPIAPSAAGLVGLPPIA